MHSICAKYAASVVLVLAVAHVICVTASHLHVASVVRRLLTFAGFCVCFIEIQGFSDTVQGLVAILSKQADAIEREKLRAIGQRNLVEHERENRRKKQQEMRAIIAEKKAELERCVVPAAVVCCLLVLLHT